MMRKYARFAILEGQHKTAPSGALTPTRSLTDSLVLPKERLMGTVYDTHTPRQTITFNGTEYEIDPHTGGVLIPLGGRKYRGLFALVDEIDLPLVTPYRWGVARGRNTFYAMHQTNRVGQKAAILMHRLILGLTDRREMGDHKNGNGLDNTRTNLRRATNQQNQFNRGKKTVGSSQYKGVCLDRRTGKWEAEFRLNQVAYSLGQFIIEELAARVYDRSVRQHYGEFANPNLPDDPARLAELMAEEESRKKPIGFSSGYGSSPYRGVSWWKQRGKWVAKIRYQGPRYFLGLFDDEIEAARAYDRKALELDPRIPRNFPEEATSE